MLRSLWCVVSVAITVVPQEQLHTFTVRIAVQLDDAVAPYLLVPPVINQHVFKAHLCRHINHLYLIVVVHTLVLPDEPAPRVTAWLVILAGLVERFNDIVRDGGLDNRLQCSTHSNGAPGCATWQRNTCPGRAQAIHLTDIRIGDRIATTSLIVAQVTGTVVRTYTRLTDEHPACRNLKQTRERKAFAKGRALIHGSVSLVVFLIRRFGALPAYHRQTLRRQKRRRSLREVKGRCLIIDNCRQTAFALGLQRIAISNIVVRHTEGNGHWLPLAIGVSEVGLTSHIMCRRSLGARHRVSLVDAALLHLLEGQSTRKIANVCFQSQCRWFQYGLAHIADAIVQYSIFVIDGHRQFAVGRLDVYLFTLYGKCHTRQEEKQSVFHFLFIR